MRRALRWIPEQILFDLLVTLKLARRIEWARVEGCEGTWVTYLTSEPKP